MIYDTRYIIEGWHYRLLILDLYLVFVENVSLARRLSAAKSQKDFLRLQKHFLFHFLCRTHQKTGKFFQKLRAG